MYQLYLGSSTAGFAPHILLREIGAPFELKLLDLEAREHKQPAYLGINPFGRVPSLVMEDGTVLTECGAILLWLADRHGDAGLAPAPDDPQRASYYQWMMFLANTLHAALMPFFYPQRYVANGDEDSVKTAAVEAAHGWFAEVDRHLAGRGPHLLGDRLTAADVYLFMLVRWGRHFRHTPAQLPALGAFTRRIFGRASVQEAFAAEGITERFF